MLGAPRDHERVPGPQHDGALAPGVPDRLVELAVEDEGISRRIGVLLRTVRRIASELMVRLTARSRFEAGVKAAKSGWIE